jgi:lipoyl-dependent peroxiredoxin
MTMTLEKVLYTAKAHTTGGRDGASRSSDGRLDIKLSVPKQMGGADKPGTNPEQLFAAGWSACFMGAMGVAAAKMKTRLPADAAIDAEVDLCGTAGEYFLQARLNVSLPGMERENCPGLGERRAPDVSLLQGHAGEYRRGDQPGVSQTNRRVASIGRTLTQPYERKQPCSVSITGQ